MRSGCAASSPKYFTRFASTSRRSCSVGTGARRRDSDASMNPIRTPGLPLAGVLSKTICTGSSVVSTMPVSPRSRQNGRS